MVYRITLLLRRSVRTAIRSAQAKKDGPTLELTGCSAAECVAHLEAQLGPSEQLSEFQIDHIFPLKAYNLLDPRQQRQAFHFSNLQPLSRADNQRKGSRMPTLAMADKVQRSSWPPGVQRQDLGSEFGDKMSAESRSREERAG